MEIMAERLRALRFTKQISQQKLANQFQTTQASMNRYEHDQSSPSFELLLKYADYFDVSMDYLFGRTDDPKGCAVHRIFSTENTSPEIERFVEMCFEPNTQANEKLKAVLIDMLKGEMK